MIAVALSCAGCGDDDNGGSGGAGGNGLSDTERACQLADASMVTAAFGVTASEGVPGIARNCELDTPGGEAESVNVFYFGDDSGWEGIRNGYESEPSAALAADVAELAQAIAGS